MAKADVVWHTVALLWLLLMRFRNHLLGIHIYYEVIEIQKSFDVKKKKYKIFPLNNDTCKRSSSCKRTCGKQPIL